MKFLASEIQRTWDFYLGDLYYRLLYLMLLVLVLFTGRAAYQLSLEWDQWMVGEWLISYASGFVRRGLAGELLILAGTRVGVPANHLVFAVLCGLSVSVCLLFAWLLRGKQLTFWYVFLFLSPAFLLFTVYNQQAVGRKELLTFVAFLLWARYSTQPVGSRAAFHVAFGLVSFALTLMHELFFFFTPYFVFWAFLASTRSGSDYGWKMALLVPGCSLLAILTIGAWSGTLEDPRLCERLLRIGALPGVCNGVLAYGEMSLKAGLIEFLSHFEARTLLGLLLLFPVILLPIYVFLLTNANQLPPRTLIAVFCGFILFSSPLFVLAVDWGRWISIHTVLLTITCSWFLPARHHAPDGRPLPARPPAAHLLLGLLLLLSSLGWSVTYCCQESYLKAFGPMDTVVGAWNAGADLIRQGD
jgi:hypothetical protein